MEKIKKKCKKCKKVKNVDEFYKCSAVKSGLRGRCKVCCNKAYKTWQQNNREKVRAINKKSYKVFKHRITYKFWRVRAGAKQRKIGFNLNFEEYKEFMEQPCFYCGDKNESLGLDRVDSNKGYYSFNIVPACYRCNVAKNNMTTKEFIKLCKKIVKRHARD